MKTKLSLFLLFAFMIAFNFCNKPNEEKETNSVLSPKEGVWEYKITISMQGIQTPEITFKNCVKKNDFIPKPEKDANECKILKQNFDGKIAEWEIECMTQGMLTKMIGKAQYTTDSMDGEITMILDKSTMLQKITGKYMGECK